MQHTAKAITLAALVCFARDATAQTCLGRPFFSTGHVQVSGGIQLGNHATAIGGGVAVGKDRSFFVQGTVDHETVDISGLRRDPDGFTFGLGAGYQAYSGSWQVCPVASVRTGKLDLPGDAELERTVFQFGAMLGMAPRASSGFHFVPYGGLSFAQLSIDAETDDDDVSLGTDTYFPLTAGLGMHFSRSFALTADVTIPIDLGNGNPFLGIRAVFPFGGRQ